MFYKELGNSGEQIPEIGVGTWNYSAGAGPLRRAFEAGALFVDTAESYGSEQAVGEAIRGIRERVFVATKTSPQNFRRNDVHRAIDGSLQRLRTEQIDLLQLHEPNPSIPISETMGAVSEAIDAGKVRYAGVSNFSVAQLREAQAALGQRAIVSNQVRYSIIDRTIESGLLQYCQTHHVSVIAYCPLARGLHRIGDCDPTGVVNELAQETGRSPAQIVLNWCLCKDGVVVIPKGNSVEHILDNCGASGWRLTAEQLARLDSRIQHRRRGPFDEAVRKYCPGPLLAAAKNAVALLPRSLRRRIH